MLSFLTGERRPTLTMLLQESELTEENQARVNELLTLVDQIYDLRTAQELKSQLYHAHCRDVYDVHHRDRYNHTGPNLESHLCWEYKKSTCVTAIQAIPGMDMLLSALLKNPFLRENEQETVFKWIKLILVLLLLALPYDVDNTEIWPGSNYPFFRHDQKKITFPECKAKYLKKKLPRNMWNLLNIIQKRELAPGNNAQQEIIEVLSRHTFTSRDEGRGDITEALYFALTDSFASLAKKKREFYAHDAYGKSFEKPYRKNTYKQLLLKHQIEGTDTDFQNSFNQFYTQKEQEEQEEWTRAVKYLLVIHKEHLFKNEKITRNMPEDVMRHIFSFVKSNTNPGSP